MMLMVDISGSESKPIQKKRYCYRDCRHRFSATQNNENRVDFFQTKLNYTFRQRKAGRMFAYHS
jgi:hypothetical protein